jgi:hypothetical protein
VRIVLGGVFVVSLLAFIAALMQPFGPSPEAVYPLERLTGDASSGAIERIEEGPDYTRAFLRSGEDYYVATPNNLRATLTAATGDPPPVKQVDDNRQLILIVLIIAFAGVLISGIPLLWDLLRSWQRQADSARNGAST